MNTLLKSLTLILLGLLGALAAAGLIRHARADLALTSAKDRMDALRQVRQIEPTRADVSARLGSRWMRAFPPRYDLAAMAFHDAATADPFDAYHWLDYARTSLRLDQKPQAERALAMAERVDPMNSEVQLDLGNIRLEMNDLARAAINHAKAITQDPGFIEQLCPFYEAAGWTPRQVAEHLLAGNQAQLERYFSGCLNAKPSQPDEVAGLWEYVSTGKHTPAPEIWQAYFQFLVRQKEFGRAKALWGRIAQAFYGNAWNAGREPFWNGDLARSLAFPGGLEWRLITPNAMGYETEIERTPGDLREQKQNSQLHFTFDGTTNVNATFVSHGLFLEPGRDYILRCQARARDLTTDNGPYLALNLAGEHPATIRSRMLTGSESWPLELQFSVPTDCGWAELTIRRDHCSRLNNKIKGEAWFGNFILEPRTSTVGEGAGKR